ncbi:alpha-L-fucosidase isoform X2 [Aplysia californica]|uniref:alpha-L-fucosidase n=1 Tax=Aplysia californica TaxID=6500 RepID=A0ABM1VUM4_APLCA|nr:alpha-L-fucosidase isoform X2 [Aplysia californica]
MWFPSFNSEWFWWQWKGSAPRKQVVDFMKKNYPPDWTYADFAKEFNPPAGIYNPMHWAEIFNASGARYIVHVTKHHEGFTSWPSKHSFNWNSMDVGPGRDLVGDLAKAVRQFPNLRYGIYHSLFEWFNPLYLNDVKNNFTTTDFVSGKTLPELYELVNTYHPDVVWSDGSKGPDTYWNSTQFLAWLYNDSPVKDFVVTNDRWGNGIACHHGGFLTCHDRYNPGVLQKRKFENAMTLDTRSWGYRRDMKLKQILSIEEVLETLVITISCNGNILINVGPTKDGTIDPVFEERLRQLGSWLGVTGEAVYGSRPWTYQNDTHNSDVWYTMKSMETDSKSEMSVYAFLLKWPDSDILKLGAPQASSSTVVTLLGYSGQLDYDYSPGYGLVIQIPPIPFNKMPCEWVWVFKLTNIAN